MDDRSGNALKQVDPFAATDALLSSGVPDEALFVINLCAANMPQAIDAPSVRAWGIPGLEAYKLYQVSRMEDGRTRYRVRLGFFTKEADAEAVLRTIRGKFASAYTSGLCDEDIKHASGYLKKPLHEIQEIQDIQRTGRYRVPKFAAGDLPPNLDKGATARLQTLKAAPTSAPPPSPTISRAASAMLSTTTTTTTTPARQKAERSNEEVVEFEWSPPQKTNPPVKPNAQGKHNVVAPSAAKPGLGTQQAKPAPVAKPQSKPVMHTAAAQVTRKASPIATQQKGHAKQGPKAPDFGFAPAPQKAAQPSASTRPSAPFHVGAGRTIPDHGLSLQAQQAALAKAPAVIVKSGELPRPLVSAEAMSKLRADALRPRNPPSVVPTLDTTQTIRTLTKKEIEDANAPKWFVVQLAISDHPANLDTMPRLDIFEAYRLYSVAVMQNNVIKHALRLGFFSEKVSAEAVMGYVKTFFGEPIIEQISDAEQKRFGESFVLAQPAEPAKPQARAITIEDKRPPLPFTATQPVAIAKSVTKSAAPAVKRSAPIAAKKNAARKTNGKPIARKELDEARMLGLSETAIRRIDPSSTSLFSRLVDKLTK
jgi:hypothetical protein